MKFKKITIILCLLSLFVYKNTNAQIHSSNAYSNIINIESQLNHFKFLCSKEAAGRGAGTKGGEIVAEYIENEFKKYGLNPFFNKSFSQEFF